MNGMTGARRLARPVRLALARQLGADIDGAWWPYTASVADELPQLIGALHTTLGEIIDICINWSATQGPRELYETVAGGRSMQGGHPGRQRLMVVEGQRGCANLLVVPHMTSQALGVMDATSIAMCRDNKLPIIVFNLNTTGNIMRMSMGEPVGTVIH